jgi:putative ABC transport system permease protein
MLLPVVGFSRFTINDHKLEKAAKPKKTLWQRYFVDIICLGTALYGVYIFNNQREIMAAAETEWVDPMLFLVSSLFIVGFGLFCLRAFPLVMRLVFYLGRRFWPPSLYASLLRVTRSAREEQFIMIFLIFTVAIGIFSAQTARTVNLNAEHETRYLSGADLVFTEHWDSNLPWVLTGQSDVMQYNEPAIERFTRLEEVQTFTRVLHDMVDISAPRARTRQHVTMMGIEPQAFAETAWFREDLLPTHINHYLNTLGQVPNGVLLSTQFMNLGYSLGSRVTLTHTRVFRQPPPRPTIVLANETEAIVVGFVERWPAHPPDNYLVVLNRGYLSSRWGQWPYQVWMRTHGGTNRFFYDLIEEQDIHLTHFTDTAGKIVNGRLEPMLQGTNGVLTMNFVVALLVCFIGFLMYWMLSIKERVLQFGIFRAMGMGMKGIVGILINEQIFITLTALAMGAVVGEVSARLFVPLIQLAYNRPVIPLRVVMQMKDYINLYAALGVMIVLCVGMLVAFVKRINIYQALKLGED